MGAVRVFAVVLVVLLAGCGGIAEQTDRDPYGVDEPVDPTGGEVLPGLTDDEVTDSVALTSAHFEALEEQAYEIQTTRYERGDRPDDNETHVRWIGVEQTVSADRATASITRTIRVDDGNRNATTSPNETIEHAVWVADDTTRTRNVDESGAVSYHENRGTVPLSPSPGLPMDRLYDAAETIEQGDDGRIELTATEVAVERLFENATYTIVLAEDGHIERYDLEGTTSGGNRLHLEITWALERLEEPDLGEPGWLEEANAEAEVDETEDEDDEETDGE